MVAAGIQSKISYVDFDYVEPLEEAVARALAKAKRRWDVEIRGENGGIRVEAVRSDGKAWSGKLPLQADTPKVLQKVLTYALAAD